MSLVGLSNPKLTHPCLAGVASCILLHVREEWHLGSVSDPQMPSQRCQLHHRKQARLKGQNVKKS